MVVAGRTRLGPVELPQFPREAPARGRASGCCLKDQIKKKSHPGPPKPGQCEGPRVCAGSVHETMLASSYANRVAAARCDGHLPVAPHLQVAPHTGRLHGKALCQAWRQNVKSLGRSLDTELIEAKQPSHNARHRSSEVPRSETTVMSPGLLHNIFETEHNSDRPQIEGRYCTITSMSRAIEADSGNTRNLLVPEGGYWKLLILLIPL